ncbi:MAG: tRNA guanosine(34) transglycosylase Tgt [Candidatus Jorgensenbacteria bacterium]|nr:tRNA guanosine(34) transglycosylase Tgt [Candidatus Jorgensenbacteria bacterium]
MFFKIFTKDKQTRARFGLIETKHGTIETPSYVVVGTHAKVRCLLPSDIGATKTQIVIANTYHLWKDLGDEGLNSFHGVHAEIGWSGPMMTDSGGFQVFSLGFAREHNTGKVGIVSQNRSTRPVRNIPPIGPSGARDAGVISNGVNKNLVRITDDGVHFTENGTEYYLDAERSIEIQRKLGADIIFAFDECTSPLHDKEYVKKSLGRTHAWAERSLRAKRGEHQKLYGIVQGGAFRDLREESARYIGDLPFDGIGIGGSFGNAQDKSFGEQGNGEMTEVLDWIAPILPEEKPRHLLGIGKIQDIFEAVERGVDTFDCVIPTREARHGSLWTTFGRFDVRKNGYKDDKRKIQNDCECPMCGKLNITRGRLYELFRGWNGDAVSSNEDPGRLATMHNVFFFNELMRKIRESIKNGTFREFKKEFCSKIQ